MLFKIIIYYLQVKLSINKTTNNLPRASFPIKLTAKCIVLSTAKAE